MPPGKTGLADPRFWAAAACIALMTLGPAAEQFDKFVRLEHFTNPSHPSSHWFPVLFAQNILFFRTEYTPLIMPISFALGFLILRGEARRTAARFGLLGLGFALPFYTDHIVPMQLANARYQVLSLALFLTPAAFAGGEALRRLKQTSLVRFAVAAGAAVLLCLGSILYAATPTALNQEYDFVRDSLKKLPAGATIYYFRPEGDFALNAPTYLSDYAESGTVWKAMKLGDELPAAIGPNTYFYLSGNCYTYSPLRPDRTRHFEYCRGWLSLHKGRKAAEGWVDAPPFRDESYLNRPFSVGFYYLTPSTTGAAAEGTITP